MNSFVLANRENGQIKKKICESKSSIKNKLLMFSNTKMQKAYGRSCTCIGLFNILSVFSCAMYGLCHNVCRYSKAKKTID